MYNNLKELRKKFFNKLILRHVKILCSNTTSASSPSNFAKSLSLYEELPRKIQGLDNIKALANLNNERLQILRSQTIHSVISNTKPVSFNLQFRSHNLYFLQWVRFFTTHINTSKDSINHTGTETQDVNHIKMFQNPKNVLHNCFDDISRSLKQKDLKLDPMYKMVKNKNSRSWLCTYNLKWPEPIKFSTTAFTKQEASTSAAVKALTWLYQNKKINDRGLPIIFEKKDIQKLKQKNYPVLDIDSSVYAVIDKVVNDEGLKTIFTNFNEEHPGDNVQQVKEEWPDAFPNKPQDYQGFDFYLSKEPVILPISSYKDQMISYLKNNNVLIIKGEPGCGKSTRAPQYVLEGWAREIQSSRDITPCRIVVTEPRRIAAISLAERVANERGENVGSTIGYHVRLKSNFNKTSGRILYCTTGILLRHIQCDPALHDVTHVVVDEAHERDVNVDLLLNLLRHALKLNPNLKIIIMSATIDAKEFQKYFGNTPILNIPGFTYPVEEHYLADEYQYPSTAEMCKTPYANVVHEDVVSCINVIHRKRPAGAILCFLPGWQDIVRVRELISERNDLYVLCLHSRLDMSDQQKIFHKSPSGIRKVILSTNIAETSVTIDDVVYVIDTGIHKEQRLDVAKGVVCIDNHWISKASAVQRKGRAGRCRPGECFRLYPKSKFEEFADYSIPEILRTSLTKIVLDSKVYSNNMNASEFLQHLICPPDESTINKAVEELTELEMLDENENLTPLGRTVSNFQLPPKLSKALVNAIIFKCATPVVDIVTMYSMDSALFSKALVDKEEIKRNLKTFSSTSDHIAMMNMFEKWLYYVNSKQYSAADQFCYDLGIVQPKLRTLQKLRNIHFDYLYKGLHDVLPVSDDLSDNCELVKGVLLSGVGNVLQQRLWDIVKGRFKTTNVLITGQNQKATITSDSVNSRKGQFPTRFLVYINETISNLRHTTLVRETSSVSPLLVLLFVNSKLVIKDIEPEDHSTNLASDDQVLLKLEKTNIGFVCDRREAIYIQDYKEVLDTFRRYYTNQLTAGNSYDSEVNKYWQNTLKTLNQILNKVGVN